MCVVKTVRAADLGQRALEVGARLAQVANALQDDEGGMSLVQVIDRGRVAHGLQDAHAADAEDDLLLRACFAIAAVQPRRQIAIPRRVLLEIGVEQVEHDAADADAPHGDEHRAVAERHGGDARLAVRGDRRLDRGARPIQLLVDLLLPAVAASGSGESSPAGT